MFSPPSAQRATRTFHNLPLVNQLKTLRNDCFPLDVTFGVDVVRCFIFVYIIYLYLYIDYVQTHQQASIKEDISKRHSKRHRLSILKTYVGRKISPFITRSNCTKPFLWPGTVFWTWPVFSIVHLLNLTLQILTSPTSPRRLTGRNMDPTFPFYKLGITVISPELGGR